MNIKKSIANSSKTLDGPLHSFAEILEQYKTVNSTENFKVSEIGLSNLNDWFFDESKKESYEKIRKKLLEANGKGVKIKNVKVYTVSCTSTKLGMSSTILTGCLTLNPNNCTQRSTQSERGLVIGGGRNSSKLPEGTLT